MAGVVSHHIHQGIFSGLFSAPQHSAIHHGSMRGIVFGNAERTAHTRYILNPVAGGIMASMCYEIPSATWLRDALGNALRLDEAQSAARYEFTLFLAESGAVILRSPVQVAYRIVAAENPED
jgi:hypothetical protein